MPQSAKPKSLQEVQAALVRGEHRRAEQLCRQLLARNAREPGARYCLGLALALSGNAEAAIDQWQRTLLEWPSDFPTLVNLGVALGEQGRHDDAVRIFREARSVDDTQTQVHFNLGNALLATGNIDEAIASLRVACVRDPRFAAARNNLGVAYRRAGRLAEAQTEFKAAIAANPAYADAHENLAAALEADGQTEPASLSFQRALQLDPVSVDAALGLSRTLDRSDRGAEALAVLQRAAANHPASAPLHHALGVLLHRAGQRPAALHAYDRAVSLQPDHAAAWRDRARLLENEGRLAEALASYRRAESLAPDDAETVAGALGAGIRACDWQTTRESLERLRQLPSGMDAIHPFLALSVCDRPEEQLRIATAYCDRSAAGIAVARPRAAPASRRIRIAYLSSDLRDHPVAWLLIGVLEHHDREAFEVHTVSLQADPPASALSQRLRRSVDAHHDVAALSDRQAAASLRALDIDIAVDLNGYTVGARPGLVAQRAAPVQVSYLGYAGTLGAPYIDYLVADAYAIPPAEEHGYRESIIRLPHCLLPYDNRTLVGAPPSRAQAGLPEHGTVFCAQTSAYKITPEIFALWLDLLAALPDSVLWLRSMAPESRGHLESAAQARGVDRGRLVFAAHVAAMSDHLARLSLADLYLDTRPYNAHSTSCDALWAGVPVLTCSGGTLASRIAGSVVRAAGLPELATQDLAEYRHRALELASDPARLGALRDRLRANRSRAALFDTRAYTRHLESAYRQIHARAQLGQPPSPLAIEP